MKDSLGDEMKAFEVLHRRVLDPRDYILVRIDGKAFHSYTRNLQKPYDPDLCHAMNETAKELCRQIQGVKLAYVESDEISLLITAWQDGKEYSSDNPPQLWMGGVEAKITSISASIATAKFNAIRAEQVADLWKMSWHTPDDIHPHPAVFDSRVWAIVGIPESQEIVSNYFKWRREDSIRNSITMAASAHFSHKQLHGVGSEAKKNMLREVGDPWEDLDEGFKYGRLIVRETTPSVVEYFDKRTGFMNQANVDRAVWNTYPATTLDLADRQIPQPIKFKS